MNFLFIFFLYILPPPPQKNRCLGCCFRIFSLHHVPFYFIIFFFWYWMFFFFCFLPFEFEKLHFPFIIVWRDTRSRRKLFQHIVQLSDVGYEKRFDHIKMRLFFVEKKGTKREKKKKINCVYSSHNRSACLPNKKKEIQAQEFGGMTECANLFLRIHKYCIEGIVWEFGCVYYFHSNGRVGWKGWYFARVPPPSGAKGF